MTLLVASEVEVSREGCEDLAAICEVCLESEDSSVWIWVLDQVEIEDLIVINKTVMLKMLKRLTLWPFFSSSGMTWRPALPLPPVKTIRLP